jgi:putative heme iron utilization protein
MTSHPEILAARRLLRSQHSAALATLSLKLAGHPFASGVDYFTDHAGRPVFLISSLAEHSKNIAADPRISLLVQGASNDVQASPRLTVVGKASGVGAAEAAGLKTRYLRYFPEAEQYFALDFFFCRLEPEQLRYVGGFGVARWIAPGDFLAEESGWEATESAAAARFPALAGLDCDGFDLRSGKLLERRGFAAPLTPDHAASALASMIESPAA